MKLLNLTNIPNDDAARCWSCLECTRRFRANNWMLLFLKIHGHLWVSHNHWRDYGNTVGTEQFVLRKAGSEP